MRGGLAERDMLIDRRYRLGTRLGIGGMGEVWEALDTRMQRQVAVKLILPGPGPRETEVELRFQREVRAAALPNEHTVTVHDCGTARLDGQRLLYLVMERLDGITLDEAFRRPSGVDWPDLVDWAGRIAAALSVAHAQKLVHRDIKPQNVVLTRSGTIKVLDFGVAAFLGDTLRAAPLTPDGTGPGTPWYMSPEQCRGDAVIDHRADLYSLGCLLYEGLAGAPPFTATTFHGVLYRQVNEEAPTPVVDGVPSRLLDLVMRLLAKNPDDRPPDADAVVRELEQARDEHLRERAAERERAMREEVDRIEQDARDRAGALGRQATEHAVRVLTGADRARAEACELRAQAERARAEALRDAEAAAGLRAWALETDRAARRTQEEAAARLREVDFVHEEARVLATRAATALAEELRERRDRAERDLAQWEAEAEERVARAEEYAQGCWLEAERALEDADEQARFVIADARKWAAGLVAEARADAERLREETSWQLDAERADLSRHLETVLRRLGRPGDRAVAAPAGAARAAEKPGGGPPP
ncbi:protein kinase [Streptomyces avidinii]|uniref:serine/threonine-protein kinase n=1 Tax=Streptomyces avidinii TaxID=1895 RepID=UPI0037885290